MLCYAHFTTVKERCWQALHLWIDAELAPGTNQGSRTNSHESVTLTWVVSRSLLALWFLPLTCCVTLDKPCPLSEAWLLHLLNEKLKVNYLRGPLALRISHLISPGAVLLSLSPKRWKVGLELGRGEQSPPFLSGLCGLQWEVPFSFFLTFLLNQKVILNS